MMQIELRESQRRLVRNGLCARIWWWVRRSGGASYAVRTQSRTQRSHGRRCALHRRNGRRRSRCSRHDRTLFFQVDASSKEGWELENATRNSTMRPEQREAGQARRSVSCASSTMESRYKEGGFSRSKEGTSECDVVLWYEVAGVEGEGKRMGKHVCVCHEVGSTRQLQQLCVSSSLRAQEGLQSSRCFPLRSFKGPRP